MLYTFQSRHVVQADDPSEELRSICPKKLIRPPALRLQNPEQQDWPSRLRGCRYPSRRKSGKRGNEGGVDKISNAESHVME
jgi:hypothetical protein